MIRKHPLLLSILVVVGTSLMFSSIYVKVYLLNERRVVRFLSDIRPIRSDCCVTSVIGKGEVVLERDTPTVFSGYVLTLKSQGAKYEIYAAPERRMATGIRFFYVDDMHIIHSEIDEPATAHSPVHYFVDPGK